MDTQTNAEMAKSRKGTGAAVVEPAIKSGGKAGKADLLMQPSRMARVLGLYKNAKGVKGGVERFGSKTPIFVAAVVESIIREVFAAANDEANPPGSKGAKNRITDEDVIHSVRGNKDLNKMMAGLVVLSRAGIHRKQVSKSILCEFDRKKMKAKKEDEEEEAEGDEEEAQEEEAQEEEE